MDFQGVVTLSECILEKQPCHEVSYDICALSTATPGLGSTLAKPAQRLPCTASPMNDTAVELCRLLRGPGDLPRKLGTSKSGTGLGLPLVGC